MLFCVMYVCDVWFIGMSVLLWFCMMIVGLLCRFVFMCIVLMFVGILSILLVYSWCRYSVFVKFVLGVVSWWLMLVLLLNMRLMLVVGGMLLLVLNMVGIGDVVGGVIVFVVGFVVVKLKLYRLLVMCECVYVFV